MMATPHLHRYNIKDIVNVIVVYVVVAAAAAVPVIIIITIKKHKIHCGMNKNFFTSTTIVIFRLLFNIEKKGLSRG